MKEMRVVLDWAGPYSWVSRRGPTILAGEHAEAAGIYLWCVPNEGSHLVYYVGQTEAGFGQRHYQHFREYAGGSYTIHDAVEFSHGRHLRAYETRAYAKGAWQRAQPFVDRFDELSKHLVGMLEAMVIFVAPLQQPRRIHRRLEAALVDLCYAAEPPSARFQDPGMRVHRRRSDEARLVVTSSPAGLFQGIPEEFDA